ncbi:MAG TPA: succinylglutamate desuccinylase/aspartoacylase family protein [Candidatus Megaira endosymbiont of Hartmannula sinica]|nr:succinylglutamate desuccinylase/aspartoacylase family protein [Candidatus Megaera endosymbiont of Hartmannula sinica]
MNINNKSHNLELDPDELWFDKTLIKRGERKRLSLKVANLFDNTDMVIKCDIIRGKKPGPILFISAAIHGDEINGVFVISKFLSHQNYLKDLTGTIITVPVVNMFGFNRSVRYLPDRRDLNRCFPGSKNGSLASQMAYLITENILKKHITA